MERKGEERDLVMQNSLSYKTPQIVQGSPVKLPLAPIVSTSSDRRANATVSTRRGSAIFSPTQTLYHHNRPPVLHLHRQLSPRPPLQQPLVVHKDPTTPGPDPAPAASPSARAASNLRTTPLSPTQPQATSSDLPPPPAAAAESGCTDTSSIKYRECLKNHAASIGGHVVDGCGEFMSSGDDGTPEALRCAACDCHRNFHRKEGKGQPQQPQVHPYNPISSIHHRNPSLHNQEPRHQQKYHKNYHYQGGGGTPPTMVNFGGNVGDAAAESSSEDLNMSESSGGRHAVIQPSMSGSKKRFRTKFSQEQKDRMKEFAAKLDWRIQKQEDEELRRFCSEVGVERQVFKVWMHNNKQAMKRRQI